MNTKQALKALDIQSNASQEEVKSSYRKKALELHPDKNKDKSEGEEFKKITEAYHYLKNNPKESKPEPQNQNNSDFKKKPQWGAPDDGSIPEQDWSKYTQTIENENPSFWKEYEKKFWEDYNARINPKEENDDYQNSRKSGAEPNVFVDVEKSLCIGCCSCEMIAPNVFEINKKSVSNPKSTVINQKGAKFEKIMSAAETCPTKAIRIDNIDTNQRMYPY